MRRLIVFALCILCSFIGISQTVTQTVRGTVTDSETGFVFIEAKIKPFNDAIRRALALYPYHSRWAALQKAGMAVNFSWQNSASKYLDLYKKLIATSSVRIAAS